ncbi:hypothetical protein M0R45_006577 [Rubus argutus]|uniref:Uncharacterized protein n=1 Tax=Rubus argutus TaxID=59490 RepID=A0AAW1YR24_RUBAR
MPHLLCQSPPQASNSLSLAAAILSQQPCRQPAIMKMEDKKEPATWLENEKKKEQQRRIKANRRNKEETDREQRCEERD